MFIFPFALACMALVASTHGAAVAQIEDVAFELDGQEYHLHPIEKRQTTNNATATPDEVGAKINNNNNNNNNNAKCQSIDLPATLQLKVCGCSNPGCPSCPCNKKYSNEGSD